MILKVMRIALIIKGIKVIGVNVVIEIIVMVAEAVIIGAVETVTIIIRGVVIQILLKNKHPKPSIKLSKSTAISLGSI